MRNFNLSVAVTSAFMEALENGTDYALKHPRTGAVVRSLPAGRVFELMVNAAWATGDPGVVFLDRINESNPTPDLGLIEATNPCGEQPLLPFESCTLGSIELSRFVDTTGRDMDWRRLREVIRDSVDFLDLVIDANRYPLPQIQAATRLTRKIGLGVMGFADALIALGIPYDDGAAEALGGKIAAFLESESLLRSQELAETFGPFPAFSGSRWDKTGQKPLRNATTTTVAPTGTLSIIAGCSSGIEPLYAVAYERRVLDGDVLDEMHAGFRRRAEAGGFASPELFERVREHGSVRGLEAVPKDVQRLFVTAHDLPAEVHLRMQAVFQKHVHAAVSKTINLPNQARPAEVALAYRLAYRLGCKGVTVFRDGCRSEQVLSVSRTPPPPSGAARCQSCGADIQNYDRCQVCRNCGWSACA
jgi:ribonucleoside-diphosphate reductase alpha chain